MLTELQKRTAQAMVNVFETGQIKGDYSKVTLLRGDTGHLTYGRSQTTLASGNLYLLISDYCKAEDASYDTDLRPYLHRLDNCDLSLDHDMTLRNILREAGDDPVMQKVQDEFFDRVYWEPCLKSAQYIQAEIPLGIGIIYDSRIHGSWHRIRNRTNEKFGHLNDIGETSWFSHYVETRREWLAAHSNSLLRRTVYRMDSFQSLVGAGNWHLELPITVHGARIEKDILMQVAPVRVSAEDSDERILKLQRPYMRGDDVKQIQQALSDSDYPVVVDGIFGPGTEKVIISFQKRNGLIVDGIAGPATRASLGL